LPIKPAERASERSLGRAAGEPWDNVAPIIPQAPEGGGPSARSHAAFSPPPHGPPAHAGLEIGCGFLFLGLASLALG